MSLSIVSNLSSLLAARSRATDGTSGASYAANNNVGLAVAVSQATVASSAYASAGPILSQNLLSALQSDPTDPSTPTPSPSTQLSANRAYGSGSPDSPNANAASTATPTATAFDAHDQNIPRLNIVS